MGKLTDKIKELEQKIQSLESKVEDLSSSTENKRMKPETHVSQPDITQISPIDISSGWGAIKGSAVPWNNAGLKRPPYGEQPLKPKKGYNRHSHNQYSGGALDINSLELVEHKRNEEGDILDSNGNPLNPHCQNWWSTKPKIVKQEGIEKIGLLDIEFDANSKKWVTGANLIDVERTYLVQYIWKKGEQEVPAGTEGATREIRKDINGNEMKSPLLYTAEEEDENLNRSNVVWDKEAQCWRFYAVFKPYPGG